MLVQRILGWAKDVNHFWFDDAGSAKLPEIRKAGNTRGVVFKLL